ncbi:hypothetical protein SDC9_95100 [bioreactor metagenome]|jgi:hypothetical protein
MTYLVNKYIIMTINKKDKELGYYNMNFWIYLILIELIPIALFVIGGIYETKSTNYPDTKIGYKTEYSIKDKFSWEYSNKVAAKIYGTVGTILFIINAIVLLIIGEKSFNFLLLVNSFMVILDKLIIDKLLKKKFEKR